MTRLSLRLKLTLFFAVAMAAVIAAMGAFVFVRLDNSLTASLDAKLTEQVSEAAHRRGTGRSLVDSDAGVVAQLIDSRGRVVSGSGAPLLAGEPLRQALRGHRVLENRDSVPGRTGEWRVLAEIGRASCRERV